MKWNTIVILSCLLCYMAIEEDDWPMFQHDPQHTGYSRSNMPSSLKELPSKEYSYETYETYFRGEFLIVSKGKFFVTEYIPLSKYLSCLDINDGSLLWRHKLRSGILWSYPAAADNRVYGGGMEEIFCLDSDTGTVVWTYEIKSIILMSSPVIVGDYIVIGSGRLVDPGMYEQAKRVLCLNRENGEVVWEFVTEGTVNSSPAYFDGKIYINDGGRIYCLDLESGELIWKREVEWTNFSSLSLNEKKIFVGTHKGVACLERETEKTLWHFKCGEMIFTTPAVAYNKVFFGTPEGRFYCVDAQEGKLIWKVETGKVISSEVLVADGKVCFGNGDGVLYIVNAKSGKISETIQLEDGIDSVVLSNGKLFVGQWNGKITCYDGLVSEFSSSAFIGIVIALLSITLLLAVWTRTRRR
jgi:outer membrane protein assembly factor BamB